MFETSIPAEKFDRIGLEIRNPLQAELIRMCVPDQDNDKVVEWAMKNGRKVSDIIDNIDNEEIRRLALAGDFKSAALLIKNILDSEEEKGKEEMRIAA